MLFLLCRKSNIALFKFSVFLSRSRHLLLLCGKALPYVAHATHLGHELHEDGTMTMDSNMRRGAFIGKCLEVQAFSFATPEQPRQIGWIGLLVEYHHDGSSSLPLGIPIRPDVSRGKYSELGKTADHTADWRGMTNETTIHNVGSIAQIAIFQKVLKDALSNHSSHLKALLAFVDSL